MKLDDVVEVYCTDHESTADGTIVGINKDSIRVLLNGVPLWFSRTKTGVYVGNAHGMEFVIKTGVVFKQFNKREI
jgi:hypothetical protein|tara:strand:+ start:8940 stop:9164 length:225 start_codon:yes stop_codon:yes gene_type:complete